MRVVIQRVSSARVTVENGAVGEIERGYVLLIGGARGDDQADVDTVVRPRCEMGLCRDDAGRMKPSV